MNIDKVIGVTFVDEEEQSLMVITLDDNGFVNKMGDEFFWATLDDVAAIRSEDNT